MKKKKPVKLTVIVFTAYIFIFSFATVLSPKKDFSDNENRVLARMPDTSLSSLFSGNFDEAFESFFSDHFVMRDIWIEAKALLKKTAGSIENNGVYFAEDGRLIRRFASYPEKTWTQNLKAVGSFCEKTGLTGNIILIPSPAYAEKDLRPSGAWDFDEAVMIDEAEKALPGQRFIRVDKVLSGHEDLYFKTDHHWNEKGALACYELICEDVLAKQPEHFTFENVSADFAGTMYSRSGAFWTDPDPLYRIDAETEHEQVMICDGREFSSIYVPEHLQEKDKYTYYIDGNHARTDIHTDNGKGTTALIIKDSYAHILVPFLAEEYEDIILIDLRYWRSSVSAITEEYEDIDLYFIYSLDNFAQDPNPVLLR